MGRGGGSMFVRMLHLRSQWTDFRQIRHCQVTHTKAAGQTELRRIALPAAVMGVRNVKPRTARMANGRFKLTCWIHLQVRKVISQVCLPYITPKLNVRTTAPKSCHTHTHTRLHTRARTHTHTVIRYGLQAHNIHSFNWRIKTTRWHLLFYCTSYRLSMFRTLLCQLSGAQDYNIDNHTGRFVLGLL